MQLALWERALGRSIKRSALITLIAACGCSVVGLSSASAASIHSTAKAAAATAKAQAQAIVNQYDSGGGPALSVPSLKKKAPNGIKVAVVDCTVPTCNADAEAAPYKALGWKLTLYPYDIAQGPPALNKSIENAINAHPKYLVIEGVYPEETFDAEYKQAVKAGIGVVIFANGVTSVPGSLGCAACHNQQFKTGTIQAAIAVAAGATAGQVAYASDPTTAPLVDDVDGADAQFNTLVHQSTLPLIQVSQAAAPTTNAATVVNYLQRNPNIKYVLFSLEGFASGVPQLLAQDGLSGRVKLITQSPEPTDIQEIAAGTEFASVASEDDAAAWRCANLLADAATGTRTSEALRSASGWHEVINKSNVKAYGDKPTEPSNYQAIFKKAWHVS